jgi:hypothetical protein
MTRKLLRGQRVKPLRYGVQPLEPARPSLLIYLHRHTERDRASSIIHVIYYNVLDDGQILL